MRPSNASSFADALLAAHAHHLVAPVQRVLDHVPPELPGGADDAHLHREPNLAFLDRGLGDDAVLDGERDPAGHEVRRDR